MAKHRNSSIALKQRIRDQMPKAWLKKRLLRRFHNKYGNGRHQHTLHLDRPVTLKAGETYHIVFRKGQMLKYRNGLLNRTINLA